MLTAQLKNGNKFSLGVGYEKEALVTMRANEEFFCPVCGERVSLKLGNQRIYHFAHKRAGTCRDFYENETPYHMEGKRQLYQWLINQGIPAELEYYDRQIGQRPDIVFTNDSKKYALEFQCSQIPENIFSKRTAIYLENGYTPIWILADNQLPAHKKGIVSLSSFSYLFLRESSSGTFHIPSYCPKKQRFQILEQLIPISIRKAFVKHSFYPLQNCDIHTLLSNSTLQKITFNHWNKELDKFKMSHTMNSHGFQNVFLNEIYKNGLNLFLLPPEIGLPLHQSVLIQTAPVIWQSYLYLDVLKGKSVQEIITPKELTAFLDKRIQRKDIQLRILPQIQLNPLEPLFQYLLLLERVGIVKQKRYGHFQMIKLISFPNSNRQVAELQEEFLKKPQLFY